MRIMVISGSATTNSNTRRLSQIVRSGLESAGIDVLYFDVGLQKLPIYDGEDVSCPAVSELYRMARQADAFFVCTPEYHNGISGALKNALDYLDSSYFEGKPVAISAAAGGGKGGINALNNLRLVLRGLYGIVLPEQCVWDEEDFPPNHSGLANHSGTGGTAKRTQKLIDQLVKVTAALTAQETSDSNSWATTVSV